jgi:type IV pilus assembly protein PilY1
MSIRKPRSYFVSAVAACLLTSLALECGQAATSAPPPTPANLSLGASPLYLGTSVKPNLIMAIDDSGSMDFELLLRANDGAAWWRTANSDSGDCKSNTANNFVGCSANGTTDTVATGVLNFNNSGNANATWKKFAYLFPNGFNISNTSDQRRLADADNDHYAIPPLPAYAWARSSDINPAYFNPSTTYTPWTNGGGFTFGNATPTATLFDPVYTTSGKTIDLTADFAGTGSTSTGNLCSDSALPGTDDNFYFRVFAGMTLPVGTCFFPSKFSSIVAKSSRTWQTVTTSDCAVNTGCNVSINGAKSTSFTLPDNTAVAIRYFPATFYLKKSTALPTGYGFKGTVLTGTAPDGTSLNGYEIKPTNFAAPVQYTAAIQNFANWFQYYRKRHQALRGGLGGAFATVSNTRVAGFTINTSGSPTSPDVTMQDIDVPDNRTSLYTQFYQNWTGQGGTPNRQALANLVRNYKRTGSSAPIQSACQQNFGMLFTDGFANPPASGDGFDKLGNIDGSLGRPYADGTSGTMADGIMGAYANSLRPDLANGKVPVGSACSTSGADPSLDCNANPHMNFFAITLGTRGLQFNSDVPVDPYTVTPAITWPNGNQLSQMRNPVAVDDLWHATINGRGALLNANSPADVADKLASVLHSIAARVGQSAAVSFNGGSISSVSREFVPSFNTNAWSGDINSYLINPDGTVSNTSSWSASAAMPAPTARQIFTVNSKGAAVPFDWTYLANDSVRAAQLEQTDTSVSTSAAVASARLGYLRGDRSQEQANGGAFRNRMSALGDIVDSAPVFVGAPTWAYPDSIESVPYSTFQLAKLNRTQAVYAGANDGMLHAFRASGGQELFAFIPGGVFSNLYRLTEPTYAHNYFVDGTPAPIDAFYGSVWHTVLVSGLNGGGQSVFALEVTQPDAYTQTNGKNPFMWEFTDAQDADLGYTFSRPVIVRLHNGKWAAVFGNGYNNTVADAHPSKTGDAVLYVVDVETGTLLANIDTQTGMAKDPLKQSRPNGLSTPVTVDIDGDGTTDYAYAGDLFGNLWKFDLTNTSPSGWAVAYGTPKAPLPLFVAKNAANQNQPITSMPNVVRGVHGVGLIVLFGTGKYLEPSDTIVANLIPESFYGIFDPNTGNAATDIINDRSNLTPQTVVFEGSHTFVDTAGNQTTENVRVVSDNKLGSSRGWYLDLLSPNVKPNGFEGEMQVTDAKLDAGNVLFNTLIPNSDPCSGGGRSWSYSINIQTGGRAVLPPFDLNGDGTFNSGDKMTLADGTVVNIGALAGSTISSGMSILQTNDTQSSTKHGKTPGDPCDYIYIPGSDGVQHKVCGNPGPRVTGRQSWRQVR